ncbi:MAG: PASTA domain-containing protein [Blastocatellia bacterium]
MKTYSRVFAVLLVLTALLLAVAASAQERAPVTPIKRTPSVILDTQARAKVTPTPSPTPKIKIKLPREIPTGIFIPKKPEEPQQQAQAYPKMPNVIGQPVRSAESLVRRLQPNARLSVQEGRYTSNYGPGVVINQSLPEGTSLKPGVEVILSYNPAPQTDPLMPDFTRFDVQAAENRLRAIAPNIEIRTVTIGQNISSFQVNSVVRQSPSPNTKLVRGTVAVLYYNPPPVSAPQMVAVPDVVGTMAPDGRRRLVQTGLATNLPGRGSFDNYIIIGQSPSPGTAVPPRSLVTLTVSPVVTVPDVRRSLVNEAQQVISQNRLRVGSVTARVSSARQDEVLSQTPSPGSVVAEGTPVNLIIAALQQVRVPAVLNEQQNRAEQLIGNARLVVGQVTKRESSFATGTVLSQSPPAGTAVNIGSPVNLVIAVSQTVAVPALRNKAQSEAEQMIISARLIVGSVTKRESPLTAGTVLDQNPPAGANVNVGSQVNFVVAIPQTVFVPDLRNRMQGAAERLIANTRLVVGQVSTQQTTAAAGTVLSQTPPAGTVVNVGSQVSFVVAVPVVIPTQTASPTPTSTPTPIVTPPESLVSVPDVTKKDLTEAINQLRAAKLEVGEVTKRASKEKLNTVLEQQPAPTQQVKTGSRVNLVIAEAPPTSGGFNPIVVIGVVALGFGAFLLGKLWRKIQANQKEKTPAFSSMNLSGAEPPPPVPALSFRSTMNASSAEFATSTEFQTSYALRFQPRADWGQQHATVDGYLIAAESEEL